VNRQSGFYSGGLRVATQAEVKQFIESNFDHEVLGSGLYKMIFNGDDGRSQLVFAAVNESNIQIHSPFATVEDVTPKQALTANADYSMGIQLMGEYYVVKHFVGIDDVDASEIKEGLSLVCLIADELEQKLIGGDKF
jgi:hypothetical protein